MWVPQGYRSLHGRAAPKQIFRGRYIKSAAILNYRHRYQKANACMKRVKNFESMTSRRLVSPKSAFPHRQARTANGLASLQYPIGRRMTSINSLEQFAFVGENSINFGAGTHACPGRYYVSQEIKIMLAHLLLHYDFKWPDGKNRPANMVHDFATPPSPMAELMFRRK